MRATGDADAAVEEFIADLIWRDLKLVAADQSCYVLHVVKGAYKKNASADEYHMLAGNNGQTSIFS